MSLGTIDRSVQVPGESMKLKDLKVLIEEHSSSVFSDFSSKRDAIAYLKRKVCLCSYFSTILFYWLTPKIFALGIVI